MDRDNFMRFLEAAARNLSVDQRDPALGAKLQLQSMAQFAGNYYWNSRLLDDMIGLIRRDTAQQPVGLDLDKWNSYARTAFRDSAMNVFHFEFAMNSLMARLNECPTWKQQVDYDLLRTISPTFTQNFRKTTAKRHAVGHEAEMTGSMKAFRANAVNGLVWRSMNMDLAARTCDLTREGQHLEIELTPAKYNVLHDLVNKAFTAFRPLVAGTEAAQPQQAD